MTRFFTVTSLSLLTLIGCNGDTACSTCSDTTPGTDSQSGDTACTASCDTGDTSTVMEPGYLNVLATIFGASVPTNVIIDSKVVGATGTDIELPPGNHIFTIGDDPSVTSGDSIVLYEVGDWNADETWSNSQWIHPPVSITIVSGQTVAMTDLAATTETTADDALAMNVYASGYWACAYEGQTSDPVPADVGYSGGDTLSMPSIAIMGVSSSELSVPNIYEGTFESPTAASVTWYQTETNTLNFACLATDQHGNPR